MISHQHKVIFIHIPKCAGRSISEALGQPFDHHTASFYQDKYPDCWREYTVFTTVRNPYQRLVSMYHYIRNEPFHAGHPITSQGNMIPFKEWVLQNVNSFREEFDCGSPEGNRETDGEWGSPFWFSSQVKRLSSCDGIVYNNISVLRYEAGMQAVEDFLQQKLLWKPGISHVNRSSGSDPITYHTYYDNELLTAVNSFQPFVHDCEVLQYGIVRDQTENQEPVTVSA